MQLTKVMFDTYRTSEYDATEPVKPWNISPPVTNSDLTAWSKNIRPQANDYKEFKDEAYWTRTKEKYVANLEACNLQHLIDDSHIVTNPDLDRSQTLWFFKVLQDKITCPAAKSIVQKHSILKNTRKLWKELCNHLDNSMNAVLRASKLSSYITSARLHSGTWRGTQTNFILHFKEQLRLYNEISDEPYTDKQGMTFLESAIAGTKNLSQVRTVHNTAQRAAGIAATWMFDKYCIELMEQTAVHNDPLANANPRNQRQANVHHIHNAAYGTNYEADGQYNVNVHDMDTDVNQLSVN